MISDRSECITTVNATVAGRPRDVDKKATIQRLYSNGMSVADCARRTYNGAMPSLDESGEPFTHLLRDTTTGDATAYGRSVSQWLSWVDTVAGWCREAGR